MFNDSLSMKLYLPIPKVSVWGLLSHLSFGEKIQGRRAHKDGTKRSYPEEQPRSNVSPSLTKLLRVASYSRGPDPFSTQLLFES